MKHLYSALLALCTIISFNTYQLQASEFAELENLDHNEEGGSNSSSARIAERKKEAAQSVATAIQAAQASGARIPAQSSGHAQPATNLDRAKTSSAGVALDFSVDAPAPASPKKTISNSSTPKNSQKTPLFTSETISTSEASANQGFENSKPTDITTDQASRFTTHTIMNPSEEIDAALQEHVTTQTSVFTSPHYDDRSSAKQVATITPQAIDLNNAWKAKINSFDIKDSTSSLTITKAISQQLGKPLTSKEQSLLTQAISMSRSSKNYDYVNSALEKILLDRPQEKFTEHDLADALHAAEKTGTFTNTWNGILSSLFHKPVAENLSTQHSGNIIHISTKKADDIVSYAAHKAIDSKLTPIIKPEKDEAAAIRKEINELKNDIKDYKNMNSEGTIEIISDLQNQIAEKQKYLDALVDYIQGYTQDITTAYATQAKAIKTNQAIRIAQNPDEGFVI